MMMTERCRTSVPKKKEKNKDIRAGGGRGEEKLLRKLVEIHLGLIDTQTPELHIFALTGGASRSNKNGKVTELFQ